MLLCPLSLAALLPVAGGLGLIAAALVRARRRPEASTSLAAASRAVRVLA